MWRRHVRPKISLISSNNCFAHFRFLRWPIMFASMHSKNPFSITLYVFRSLINSDRMTRQFQSPFWSITKSFHRIVIDFGACVRRACLWSGSTMIWTFVWLGFHFNFLYSMRSHSSFSMFCFRRSSHHFVHLNCFKVKITTSPVTRLTSEMAMVDIKCVKFNHLNISLSACLFERPNGTSTTFHSCDFDWLRRWKWWANEKFSLVKITWMQSVCTWRTINEINVTTSIIFQAKKNKLLKKLALKIDSFRKSWTKNPNGNPLKLFVLSFQMKKTK